MSALTLVGLPLGNIEDISLRQLKALFSTEVVLAEDTRNYIKIRNILSERFGEIIQNFGLNIEHKPQLISYREQNHKKITPQILGLLSEGKEVILVSDAGMPAISDPGFRLVEEALNANLEVDVIPGPTAIETALVISGLPTDRFMFLGFLPRQRSKIEKLLSSNLELTTIIYESPYRVIKTLEIIKEISPEARVAACNDLTKKFQKVWRGRVGDVLKDLQKIKIQGEWVICLSN